MTMRSILQPGHYLPMPDGIYYIDDVALRLQALFQRVRVTYDCYRSPRYGFQIGEPLGLYSAYAKAGARGRVVLAHGGIAEVIFERASELLVSSEERERCVMRIALELLEPIE